MSEAAPPTNSLASWWVGERRDGVIEVTIRLRDLAEAKAWADWLMVRGEAVA